MAKFYWLASYPKSGNTWFRIFVSNLERVEPQSLSINQLRSDEIASSRLWLDDVLGFDTADLSADEVDNLRPGVYAWTAGHETRDYCKIHDACVHNAAGQSLADPSFVSGVLYIVRNPLDIVASFANQFRCSLDEAIERMGNADAAFCSSTKGISLQVRQQLMSWSGHVASWLDVQQVPVHVIRYEDMHDKPLETFGGAAHFLKLPCDKAGIERAIGVSSFRELAAQEARGGFKESLVAGRLFFRQGQVDAWRDTLTSYQARRVIEDHHAMMARLGYLDEAMRWLEQQE